MDPRYGGQYDDDQALFSNDGPNSMKDDDNTGAFGRRVYLESPSLGNKEEEDMYRYVPSRISDHGGSVIGTVPQAPTTSTNLMDTLDFELDILGTNNNRAKVPHRGNAQVFQDSKPVAQRAMAPLPPPPTNYAPMSDPRQDPLLGPLLAELDAMSSQQAPAAQPVYRRSSVPYQPTPPRPSGLSQSNHVLANRTISDALLEAELYESLERGEQQQQQPLTRPIRNSANYSQGPIRAPTMTNTDVFMPSSYSYEPASFLSQFGPEEQLFQRPSLNHLGQNYLANPRGPQRESLPNPAQRPLYAPPQYPSPHYTPEHQQQAIPNSNPYQRMPMQQQPQAPTHYEEPAYRPRYSSDNQDTFFSEQTETYPSESNSLAPPPDDDSKRQAVWNDLQRSNVQKRESAPRTKPNPPSGQSWQHPSSQQSKGSLQHQYRPSVGQKVSHMDENIDMIRNKENSYHRSPAKRYENAYARRAEHEGSSVQDKQEQEYQYPSTRSMQPEENNPQENSTPKTVAIPLNSQVSRVGDKISLNIDLRLVDVENMRDQAGNQPHWAGLDPLDKHIRKLERNLDQSLPTTNAPQRSPVIPSTGLNGRQGRMPAPPGRAGYNPPSYGGYYNDKPQEEDSYLAKMNYARKNPQFKPYTGRDYEQFKKNYGFGTGHLGYEHASTTYKEKSENMAKTREYAQQVEARNKKKLFNPAQRTYSDSRLPHKGSPAQRPLKYARLSTRPQRLSGPITRLSPFSNTSTHTPAPTLNFTTYSAPVRRPTEILHWQGAVPKQPRRLPSYSNARPTEPVRKPSPVELVQETPVPVKQLVMAAEKPTRRRVSSLKPLPPIKAANERRPIKFEQTSAPPPKKTPDIDPPPVKEEEDEELFFVE